MPWKLAATGTAPAPKGPDASTGDAYRDVLVQKVKAFQRLGPPQKEQWHSYCDSRAGGIRDPFRLALPVLEEFILSSGSGGSPGAFIAADGGFDPIKEKMAQEIKAFQRSGPAQTALWQDYADKHLGGSRDPARHDAVTLKNFLKLHVHQSQGSGSLMKDQLVSQIKAYQRTGEEQKVNWHTFADMQLGGIRDPARHDAATLQGFAEAFSLPTVAPEPAVQPMPMPMPGLAAAGSLKDQLVQQVKLYQRSGQKEKDEWHGYADRQLGGVRDPARHEPAVLQEFLSSHGAPSISEPAAKRMKDSSGAPLGTSLEDPVKQDLVMQIKAYQRMGQQQKDAWHDHADQQLQGVRDPARHDASVLAEFISTHGVPSLGAHSASPFDLPKDLAPPTPKAAFPTPKREDPGKQDLVLQIKAYQRANQQQKDTWHEYADAHLGGVRDPNRHDAAVLEEFISTHGVPIVAAPPSAGIDPVKDQLVAQVKAFQSAGKEQKDIWHDFADTQLGGTRDPARHDAASLQLFFNSIPM